MARSSPRAFESERAPVAAPAELTAEDFDDREIGILAEHGNFERARVLLAKRSVQRSDDARVFLDAIRVERSAAPGGEAWQAWLSRALACGAQVATALPSLVPLPMLRACLVRQGIGWASLRQQNDKAAARELLRLRLEHELLQEPSAALVVLEDPALAQDARADDVLLRLAVGVMAAAVWRAPERVQALAPQYGIELEPKAESGASAPSPALDLLIDAARLQTQWKTVVDEGACPPPLDRFVRIGQLVSAVVASVHWLELRADLRARPREYLRCAENVARVSTAMFEWLKGALGDVGRELCGAPASIESDVQLGQAIDQRLDAGMLALGRDPIARWWWLAVVLVVTSVWAAWHWLGAWGLTVAVVGALGLGALRRAIDVRLYRRHLRPLLLDATVALGVGRAAIVQRMNRSMRRYRRMAEGDAPLALIGTIATHAPTEKAPGAAEAR